MKTAVILGAGQMGRALTELINTNRYRITAIGDNDPGKHNTAAEPPVMSVEEALAARPETAVIAVMGEDRAAAIKKQALDCGYTGRILLLSELSDLLDVRGRTIKLICDRINDLKIPGAAAELGVYKGDTARLINLYLPDRAFWLFDTFEGFDERDKASGQDGNRPFREGMFADTSEEMVTRRLPHPEKAVIRKGYFPETAAGLEEERYALVSLDPDLYAPVLAGLRYFFPRLSPGGMIVLHDYNNKQFPGAHQAVSDFETENGRLLLVPLADLHGSCVIMKQE